MESPQGIFQITRMALLTHSILLEQIPFGQTRKGLSSFDCVILLHLQLGLPLMMRIDELLLLTFADEHTHSFVVD